MNFKFLLPLAAAAAFASSANAALVITEYSGNLAAFGASIDEDNRIITLRETWGPNTAAEVILKFEGWTYDLNSWTVVKYVTNDTGVDMTEFSHELLTSDLGGSNNTDGLSFAQFGIPDVPRTSDSFMTVTADEIATRDYLNYTDGTILNGYAGEFGYGLTARRDTDTTNPFFLRQKAAVVGVPEPATWAMLISGFGLVGFAMRRRRTLVTVSA